MAHLYSLVIVFKIVSLLYCIFQVLCGHNSNQLTFYKSTMHTPSAATAGESTGIYALGILSVVIFALTLPMSKLALGTATDPQFNPWFTSFGRSAVAGLLSIGYLWWCGARHPQGHEWWSIAAMAGGNGLGFALLQNWGLMYVSSAHAAVFNGVLPLMTAALSTWVFTQRAPIQFWIYSMLAGLGVVAFALLRAYQHDGVVQLHGADALLLGAVAVCAFGYAYGARLARTLPAAQGLCWMLVCILPISIPASLATWPTHPISTTAWVAFGYLSVCSMWIGMMFWYYALNQGGAMRISQIQIIQPFLSVLFAYPILGETLEVSTIGFALGVMALTYLGKRVPIQTASTNTRRHS